MQLTKNQKMWGGLVVLLVVLYILHQRGLLGGKSKNQSPSTSPVEPAVPVIDSPHSTDAEYINSELISGAIGDLNIQRASSKWCKCNLPNGWQFKTQCDRGQSCATCCEGIIFQEK